jgi:hypothetical protein
VRQLLLAEHSHQVWECTISGYEVIKNGSRGEKELSGRSLTVEEA